MALFLFGLFLVILALIVECGRGMFNKNKKVLLDDPHSGLDWFERTVCVLSVITIVVLVIK